MADINISPDLHNTDNNLSSSKTPAPKDQYNYLYCVFILLGVVIVLPTNALLQSINYLDSRLPDKDISFVVGTIAYLPIFITQIVMLKLSGMIDLKKIIVVSLVAMGGLCFSIPLISDNINIVNTLWVVIIIVLVLFFMANGTFQSAAYGYAGSFPPRIIASLGNGCGLSGVIIGL
jgi:hypothetical protein